MFEEPFRLGPGPCAALLRTRLAEKPPGRIQLLTGPRQAGKTTILLDLARDLGDEALYAAADGPAASLPGWWERTWQEAEERAEARGRCVLLLDEIHLQHDWAARLKGRWDRLRRKSVPVQVVATGSSALRVAAGSRESLAGRFERVTLAHWTASDLAGAFGLDPEDAVDLLVERGAYPGAVGLRADPARWAAYVRDSIVEPAVGRDLLSLGAVRKPALLRQVFAVCAAHPARILSLDKMRGLLRDAGALETVAHYLALLEEGYLVAAVGKHSARAHRMRSSPPKIVVLSNAFVAAMDAGGAPDAASLGMRIENACLAHAWNSGQRVSYWREEPLEVDGVFEGSWGRWAVEVKAGSAAPSDLAGLLEFTRRYPAFRPLLLGAEAARGAAASAGIAFQPWREFLGGRPPST